jgi:plastocyanin
VSLLNFRRLLALPLLAAAVVVPGAGQAAGTSLVGTVGPGPSISLTNADGVPVIHLDPGTYTILVHDKSVDHNFHLLGPGGVDQSTDVAFIGDATWTVTLVNGKYVYQCDAHPGTMHKTFTSGVVPVALKLNGTVGPGKTISLKTTAGAKAKVVAPGSYKITVKDKTKADNFHLTGPGVNKKTGVRFRGTVTWNVKLIVGKTYRYRSDAHKKLAGSFVVKKLPLPAG